MSGNNYNGPERRSNRVYVTHNSEYYLRGDTCVAVRDRNTGHWLDDHRAVGHKLEGGLLRPGNGGIIPHVGPPAVGESALFDYRGGELITSPIERIERPAREAVARYALD